LAPPIPLGAGALLHAALGFKASLADCSGRSKVQTRGEVSVPQWLFENSMAVLLLTMKRGPSPNLDLGVSRVVEAAALGGERRAGSICGDDGTLHRAMLKHRTSAASCRRAK